jgi:hypothetical protein
MRFIILFGQKGQLKQHYNFFETHTNICKNMHYFDSSCMYLGK